ncbi:MAG: hypothetical protein Q6L19_00875 [Gloeomargarita sp. GMQP_bins_69]
MVRLSLLVFGALGWRWPYQSWLALGLAGLLPFPALATLASLVQKLYRPWPPQPRPLSLLRFRHREAA